jgi:hypothetical protein
MTGWNLRQINAGGLTTGPTMSIPNSSLCVSVYKGQQHVAYFDGAGVLWDSWFDTNTWKLQKINDGGCTTAPAGLVTGTPSAWVVWGQQHFTYRDPDGNIWDPFFDGNTWHVQKINSGGCTKGPAATSDPFGCIYLNGQQHVGYFAGGDFVVYGDSLSGFGKFEAGIAKEGVEGDLRSFSVSGRGGGDNVH